MKPRGVRWRVTLAVCATAGLIGLIALPHLSAASKADTTASAAGASADGKTAGDQVSTPDAQSAGTEEGAVNAALQLIAASQQWLYLDAEPLTAALRDVTAPEARDDLAGELTAEVRQAQNALRPSTGRVWWVVRPLAWRVESYDGARATVSVWTVSVLSAEGVALPQSEWVTTELELRWGSSGWALVSVRDSAGPTPQLGTGDTPWSADEFDDALAGFTRVGSEPPP